MKIAIPYAEEQVFQHFNEASQFKIYTVDEFDILEEELVSISQDTPAQTAAALKDQGVNVVIFLTDGVKSSMRQILRSKNSLNASPFNPIWIAAR